MASSSVYKLDEKALAKHHHDIKMQYSDAGGSQNGTLSYVAAGGVGGLLGIQKQKSFINNEQERIKNFRSQMLSSPEKSQSTKNQNLLLNQQAKQIEFLVST